MKFQGIVTVDESPELRLSVVAILNTDSAMPHLHETTNAQFGPGDSLGLVDLGEFGPAFEQEQTLGVDMNTLAGTGLIYTAWLQHSDDPGCFDRFWPGV